MHVDHAFVFSEATVWLRRNSFRVETLDRGVQPAKSVATIAKRDLRDQQNQQDDENY